MLRSILNNILLIIFLLRGYECISYSLNEVVKEKKAWKSISCSENGRYVYLIAIYDYIYQSSDYLNTLSVINFNKRGYNSISTSSSGRLVIASTTSGFIHSSVNFGVNWNELTTSENNPWVQISMNSNGLYIYMITSYDSIYYSTNWYSGEGYSISKSNSPIKLWQRISCSSSGQYVYAVAKNDYIYLSTDYGSTWTVSYNSKMMWSGISTSSSGQYVYSLVNGQYIYRSSNYGDSWSVSNPSFALWSFVTVANTSVYAVDSFGKIHLSDLTTNAWVKINSNKIPDAVVSVSYDNNYVYVLAPNLPVYSLDQIKPTAIPTSGPPTNYPSHNPTFEPTVSPSNYPSNQPSNCPTTYPTIYPTNLPSNCPTNNPTVNPTMHPTDSPTSCPSTYPTALPTNQPSNYPSIDPTITPTLFPTNSPTNQPTTLPPTSKPSISPTNINNIPYSVTTNGLVAFIDFADSRSYSGSGSTYTNIVDSTSQYFYGIYSQNSDKSMRIVNSASACNTVGSGIHLNNYNIYSVSMWIRRDSTQSSCTYLIDARTGLSAGYLYNGGVGSSWSYMSINGGSYTSPSSSISTILPLSTWTYITLIASAQGNAGIYFASRYVQTEGLDCSIKSIYVYSTYINQTTNYANYLASSGFITPTKTPTISPSI